MTDFLADYGVTDLNDLPYFLIYLFIFILPLLEVFIIVSDFLSSSQDRLAPSRWLSSTETGPS